MVTISLTTDWGTSGFYTGLFKAKLVQKLPGAQIVDISHEIPPFKIDDAVYALRNAYPYFAPKTIHVVAVASEDRRVRDKNREFICFQYNYQYFIGPNNGLWEMLLDDVPEHVYKIHLPNRYVGSFPESDAIVNTIGKLSMGVHPEKIGEEVEFCRGSKIGAPMITADDIVGNIMYFDTYGNGITNIRQEDFERVGRNRPFFITVTKKTLRTDVISENYEGTTPDNTIIALFNVSGFLEVAMSYYSLKSYLPPSDSKKVLIQFFNSEEEKHPFELR